MLISVVNVNFRQVQVWLLWKGKSIKEGASKPQVQISQGNVQQNGF